MKVKPDIPDIPEFLDRRTKKPAPLSPEAIAPETKPPADPPLS
jgi:hypothetical protein